MTFLPGEITPDRKTLVLIPRHGQGRNDPPGESANAPLSSASAQPQATAAGHTRRHPPSPRSTAPMRSLKAVVAAAIAHAHPQLLLTGAHASYQHKRPAAAAERRAGRSGSV